MKALLVLVVAPVLASCSSFAPTPNTVAAPGTDAPDGSARTGGDVAFRMSFDQDIAPEHRFTWYPFPVLTTDGLLITLDPEAPSREFPDPLLRDFVAVTIPETVFEAVVAQARGRGLLDGDGSFLPEPLPAQATQGVVEIRIDDTMRSIRGDPNAQFQCVTTPCEPAPASPEAFGAFWREAGQTVVAAGNEAGPSVRYQPEGYALLFGSEPLDTRGLELQRVAWPLATALAETGTPIRDEDGAPRCAEFRGDDAATLAPSLEAGTVLTRWTDGAGSEPVAFQVRPLLPGDEDVCERLFGAG